MMFPKETFELPLEKQLRFQVVKKEIENCRDIDALQENLITCAESLMKYQHVCAKLAEENLKGLMSEVFSTMGIAVIEKPDA